MNYSELRARARDTLRDRWALSIGVAVVVWLFGGLMTGTTFLPEFSYRFGTETMTLEEWVKAISTISRQLGSATVSISALGLVQFLLGGVIQLGYARFLLKEYQGQPGQFNDLFSQFHRFGQGFAQLFLRTLYTILWSLLFVIPGIVKSYSYAMTPFIMADHPELSANEAISRSRELMDGHKGELFLLRLTFLGWNVLAAITMNVGNLVLNPYKNAAEAAFYRNLVSMPRYHWE